ncbi:hypothetical protein [Ligilactobacillus acidipiscis]|uniref:hypothetical protein n=1 Tax=Ligilactobacillus acidipiscis TaxID=89059 RepID=UPI0023F62212|nr:hypothetical protein [Ligilactobacillus acidipiscis]WEV58201.1 hypothetical protein OZX66_12325 [Ligilactobacillus acidipiscis]
MNNSSQESWGSETLQFLIYWLLPIILAGITWFLYSYLSIYSLTEEGVIGIVGGLYVVVSLGSDFLTLFTGDKESKLKLQKTIRILSILYIIFLVLITLISWII